MRKLAKIVTINELHPIEGADRIELAKIDGWQVVTQKGNFEAGDRAVYFEYDSMLPLDDERFASFAGRNEREVDGKKYVRIKTMKLRKTLSQGVLMPVNQFWQEIFCWALDVLDNPDVDLAEYIGVIKYEPNIPAQLAGKARGNFPQFLRKTDQERVNNIKREYEHCVQNHEEFEVTVKLDGSSCSIFTVREDDGFRTGVCSRNLELEVTDENKDNNFVQAHNQIKSALDKFSDSTGRSIALQGELCGPGIQGNFEGLDNVTFFVFDVFDIDEQRYLLPIERTFLLNEWFPNVATVPYLGVQWLPSTIDECIDMADGPTGLYGKYREGLVFKSMERDFSFKAIGVNYLLKEK